jgi:hypothetical protein
MANRFVETITSGDSSIYATTTSHTPYYTPDDKNLHDGAVRTTRGGFEYYDVNRQCWFPLPGADINLTVGPQFQIVLDWAMRKMNEEEKIKKLAEKYPALKQAKENYDLIKAMVENE